MPKIRVKMINSSGKKVNADFEVNSIVDSDVKAFALNYANLTDNTVSGAAKQADYEEVLPKGFKVVALPTQKGTVTYDGTAQHCEWNGYDPLEFDLDGEVEATDAGVHTVGFTPKNKCFWSDLSQDRRTTTWTMNKAAGSVSVSASEVTLSRSANPATVTVTRSGDGEISASSTAANVAIVSGTDSLTITGVAPGSATINVSVAEGTNHLAATTTIAVNSSVPTISTTLNDNSWEDISYVSQAGLGDLYWDVGDAKEITLNGKVGDCFTATNLSLCVFILDFNHPMNGTAENNIIWGGFKSALTGGKDVALVDAKYNAYLNNGTICFNLNHTGQTSQSGKPGYYNTNFDGWRGSDFRYDILGATSTAPSEYNQLKTISNRGNDATAATLTSPKADTLLAALPSDLRSAMRLWTRWIGSLSNVDAITLLNEFEIFGKHSCAEQQEQNYNTQMAYYKNGNSTIRYKHNDTTSAVYWWQASRYYRNSMNFCMVATSGVDSYVSADKSMALAPAFKT